MLEESENNLYIYVVDRDFGFAPNPFHGFCTLATCKPQIRRAAHVEDWVMGVGGNRLKAKGRCIFLMKVSQILTYDTYWTDVRFRIKKPIRNGSQKMMVGDNIYHRDVKTNGWIQEDSHHSNQDSSMNIDNQKRDTKSENVLVSKHFYYFGSAAIPVDLASLDYKNGVGHSKKGLHLGNVAAFLKNFEDCNYSEKNRVIADPFDFGYASKRVDQKTRIIK